MVTDIVIKTCGLGRHLIIKETNRELISQLTSKNIAVTGLNSLDEINKFQTDSFDSIILIDPEIKLFKKYLRELYTITNKSLLLIINNQLSSNLEKLSRKEWELLSFSQGFRKSSRYYLVNNYSALNVEGTTNQLVIPLNKIPFDALSKYPLDALREERDLHMDMLRETGERSDAHIIRYQNAAQYIRQGDVVLDAACGLGYGSYILFNNSLASKVIGIDGSDYGVDYALLNYAIEGKLEYHLGYLPQCLAKIQAGSIDFITSFETLEHVDDPQALLREFHRILAPGGRIMVSAPNDWSDETGEDPNPYHLHVYDWNKLKAQLAEVFDNELAFNQTASRCKDKTLPGAEWKVVKRSWLEVDLDSNCSLDDCEWWNFLAMKSPFDNSGIEYHDLLFGISTENNVVAFKRDYLNPWLIKAMISIGMRSNSQKLLRKYANQVLASYPLFSVDAGAALCLIGYQLLSVEISEEIQSLMLKINEYLSSSVISPQYLRWQVSLTFLMGLLAQKRGNLHMALEFFLKTTKFDVLQYHPTLATKVIEAAYQAGQIYISLGLITPAREIWQDGLSSAFEAAKLDTKTYIQDIENPLIFAVAEISEVFDIARKCANAIHYSFSRQALSSNIVVFSDSNKTTELNWHKQDSMAKAGEIERLRENRAEIIAEKDKIIQWWQDQVISYPQALSEKEEGIAFLQNQIRILEKFLQEQQIKEGTFKQRVIQKFKKLCSKLKLARFE